MNKKEIIKAVDIALNFVIVQNIIFGMFLFLSDLAFSNELSNYFFDKISIYIPYLMAGVSAMLIYMKIWVTNLKSKESDSYES